MGLSAETMEENGGGSTGLIFLLFLFWGFN